MMCNNCIGRVSPIRQTVVQHHRTIIGILYNNISPLGSISLYFIIDGLSVYYLQDTGSGKALQLRSLWKLASVSRLLEKLELTVEVGQTNFTTTELRLCSAGCWTSLENVGTGPANSLELSYPPPPPPPPPPPLTCYVAGQRNQELPQSPLVVEFVIFLCY